MKYEFRVISDTGFVKFQASKVTLDMLEEEIGRYERHFKNKEGNDQDE